MRLHNLGWILSALLRMTVFSGAVLGPISANATDVKIDGADGSVTAQSIQEQSPPKGGATTVTDRESPSSRTPGKPRSDQLEQVVVTAERFAADVQHVPAQIVVLQGQNLRDEGRISVQQMLEDVPNVTFRVPPSTQATPDNPNRNISIRGIQPAQQTGGTPGPAVVATYVDDVFQGIGQAYDLNRVEVLYGPQGTLYGRSSTAGVVAFHTNDPILNQFSSGLFAEYGSDDLRNAVAILNLPVGDSLALRAAAHIADRHGFWWNVDGGTVNTWEGRIKALYEASNLKVLLSASYETLNAYTGGPQQVLSAPETINFSVPGTIVRPAAGADFAQYMANVAYDFGNATLTYVGSEHSYHQSGFEGLVGPPFMPIDNTGRQQPDQFNMHELRLASNQSGPLVWLIGANFYSNIYRVTLASTVERATQCGPCGIPDTTPGVAGGEIFSSGRSGSVNDYAVFTEETYSPRPNLHFTAGLRFDHNVVEQTTFYNFNVNLDPYGQSLGTCSNLIAYDGAPVRPCVYSEFFAKVRFDNVTYKVRAAYDIGASNMLYAMVSTGYLPGDVQISPMPQSNGTVNYIQLPYAQEQLTSYEIGSKNRFFGERLQLNGDVFYYDYQGWQQAAQLGSGVGGAPIFAAVSVPLRVVGAELDAVWLPTPADRFTLLLGAYDDEIRSWPNLPGTSTSERNYISIKRLPGTPPASGMMRYQHSFALANGSKMAPWVEGRYRAGENLTELTAAQYARLAQYDYQPSYALLFAGATWDSPQGTFRITAYGRNLGNHEVKTTLNLLQSTFSVIPGEPRVYGVNIQAHF